MLRRAWDHSRNPELRQTALTAIATLRTDPALDFLIELIAAAPGPSAREAIRALALFRDDEALAARVRQVAEARDDVDLAADLDADF